MGKGTARLDELRELLADWRRHLKATNKAASTISTYMHAGEEFADYLDEAGLPTAVGDISHQHIEGYLVHLAERPNRRTGAPVSAAHIQKHYRSLQQLFKWLHTTEGEIPEDPFAKLTPPDQPEQPVPVLSDEQLTALLAAAAGNEFENRRDTALLRVLIDTGVRVGELAALTEDDLDFEMDIIHVFGKGRRHRAVPFGPKAGDALRRYLRARRRHPHANRTGALWIGGKGKLQETGIRQVLNRRAEDAGLDRIHPHQFRHTMAHRWLAEGNQEQDLMRLLGWRSREMLYRYGASAADERAREAHRRAGLGDRI